MFFFYKEGLSWNKGTKVKKTSKTGGGLKIYVKNIFEPPIFFSYQMIGPLNFIKFNFSIKLHFTHFSVIFWLEEKKKVVGFRLKKKNVFVGGESSYQNICFVVLNDFIWQGVKIKCFFILKTLKNRIWAREVFLFRVNFKFWGGFVCFSEPWIGLTKYIECFLGVLGQRWVQNNFLDEKNKGPCFSSHHSAQIMRMNRWRVLCSIKLKKIYRPACLGLVFGSILAGP